MLALQLLLPLWAHLAAAPAPAEGPARVEFDDRLVRGQRHGAGAVYLFQRERVEMRSMVARPRSFRQRIVQTVFQAPPPRS